MKLNNLFCWGLLGLLPLSCGGEPPSETEPDDADGCPGGVCTGPDGSDDESMGMLVVTSEPALAGLPPLQVLVTGMRYDLDRRVVATPEAVMAEGEVGGEALRISLPVRQQEMLAGQLVPVGYYDVRFNCPGYAYAVAGYEFLPTVHDGQGGNSPFTVADWIMEIKVRTDTPVEIHATLCRDFTGETWYRFDNPDDNFETGMAIYNGRCSVSGLQPAGFYARGDMIITTEGWGSCAGAEALVENDQHFEFDCPAGDHYEYNRLVE